MFHPKIKAIVKSVLSDLRIQEDFLWPRMHHEDRRRTFHVKTESTLKLVPKNDFRILMKSSLFSIIMICWSYDGDYCLLWLRSIIRIILAILGIILKTIHKRFHVFFASFHLLFTSFFAPSFIFIAWGKIFIFIILSKFLNVGMRGHQCHCRPENNSNQVLSWQIRFLYVFLRVH